MTDERSFNGIAVRILQARSEQERDKIFEWGREHRNIAETIGLMLFHADGRSFDSATGVTPPQCLLCSMDLTDSKAIVAFVVLADHPDFNGEEVRVCALCRNCGYEDRDILETRVVAQINKDFFAGKGLVAP